MSEPARHVRPKLRVAIVTSSEGRKAALAGFAGQIESVIVVPLVEADLVLTDGFIEVEDGTPVIAVGGGEANDAAGVLPAEATVEQIAAALHAVAAGLRVRTERPGFEADGAAWPSQLLTPREIDVLSALTKGQSNKEIARVLAISQHTVKFHVEAIFRKLGVRSRAEAVAKGLTRVDL